jgi:hypothetical protein
MNSELFSRHIRPVSSHELRKRACRSTLCASEAETILMDVHGGATSEVGVPLACPGRNSGQCYEGRV